jgi:hypothetical protein
MSCSKLTNVTIPDSVTNIERYVFDHCTSLGSITIPSSVSSIESYAFQNCTSLTGVYFKGHAPKIYSSVFAGDDGATIYYLPETIGEWGTWFGGCPTALWKQ